MGTWSLRVRVLLHAGHRHNIGALIIRIGFGVFYIVIFLHVTGIDQLQEGLGFRGVGFRG